MISGDGLLLGMRPKHRAAPTPVLLGKGDRLFLYTDGVAESLAIEVSDSGFDQLIEFVKSRPFLPLEESCADLLEQHPFVRLMAEHPDTVPQPDDFTIVIIERRP